MQFSCSVESSELVDDLKVISIILFLINETLQF